MITMVQNTKFHGSPTVGCLINEVRIHNPRDLDLGNTLL